jgi:hypothetical protein
MAALTEYLALDPTSPSWLRWIKKPSRGVLLGAVAFGSIDLKTGYLRGMLHRKHYQAHRVVFFLANGYMPEMVDHKDGDRANNSPSNLLDRTASENQHNRVCKGYAFCKQTGTWRATIKLDSKFVCLGRHATEDAARAAYLVAKAQLHPTAPNRVYGGVLSQH